LLTVAARLSAEAAATPIPVLGPQAALRSGIGLPSLTQFSSQHPADRFRL
jgi:hypothetical protein